MTGVPSFKELVVGGQERQTIAVAPLACALVLDDVGGELRRLRVGLAGAMRGHGRQDHQRRLVGVVDIERLVRRGVDAQEASASTSPCGRLRARSSASWLSEGTGENQ